MTEELFIGLLLNNILFFLFRAVKHFKLKASAMKTSQLIDENCDQRIFGFKWITSQTLWDLKYSNKLSLQENIQ